MALLRGLDIPGYFNGASRGLLPPNDPHHFDRTRSKAFDKADVIVIVGTPFDFRMGYGKRISRDLKLVQIDMSYSTVGKNREIDPFFHCPGRKSPSGNLFHGMRLTQP